jgi:hypothetical protein
MKQVTKEAAERAPSGFVGVREETAGNHRICRRPWPSTMLRTFEPLIRTAAINTKIQRMLEGLRLALPERHDGEARADGLYNRDIKGDTSGNQERLLVLVFMLFLRALGQADRSPCCGC